MRDILVPNDFEEYTSFGGSIDLYSGRNRPACYLKAVTGSGSLQVIMSGSRGAARTVTLGLGDVEEGSFMTVVSSTGITRLRVGWN